MNCYSFYNLEKGQQESFETEITEAKMKEFCSLSGDINPLHNDESFAVNKGFNGRVVYGHLTAAFFSTLAGVYLPGEKCLIREVNYKFTKPVYIGEKRIVTGEVMDKDVRTKEVFLKVRIYRKAADDMLVRGTITVGILD